MTLLCIFLGFSIQQLQIILRLLPIFLPNHPCFSESLSMKNLTTSPVLLAQQYGVYGFGGMEWWTGLDWTGMEWNGMTGYAW